MFTYKKGIPHDHHNNLDGGVKSELVHFFRADGWVETPGARAGRGGEG